jgi:hypothetical protein
MTVRFLRLRYMRKPDKKFRPMYDYKYISAEIFGEKIDVFLFKILLLYEKNYHNICFREKRSFLPEIVIITTIFKKKPFFAEI